MDHIVQIWAKIHSPGLVPVGQVEPPPVRDVEPHVPEVRVDDELAIIVGVWHVHQGAEDSNGGGQQAQQQ